MADDDRPPVRKIPEGVSGLPDKGPAPTPRPIKADPDDPRFGTGNYWIQRGRNYNKGGMVKAGSPKVSAPCADSKTIKCL